MGLFENDYPYTDFHELNLDWVIKKITEFEKEINNIETSILDQAKTYTDNAIAERLSGVEEEFSKFKSEVNAEISKLDGRFNALITTVNARMEITEGKFRQLEAKVNTVLAEANEYTNYAIQQNNAYIIDQTTKALSTVTVLNYFTGARVSIQEMFDYLAQFHLDNAVSYDELFAADKTYNELIAYNEDYTNWAIHGKTIIQ